MIYDEKCKAVLIHVPDLEALSNNRTKVITLKLNDPKMPSRSARD